jgi:hypothetical protein
MAMKQMEVKIMIAIQNDPTNVPSYNGSSLYGNFRTRSFADIYTDLAAFKTDYTTNGIPETLSETNLTTIYYLLYARYGNSSIASSDETQFKYKLFSTIFMYGPAWQKRLEIQKKLLELSDDEIVKGTTAIYNTALNPSQSPSTQSLEELNYINSQNTTKYKKSKIEGYATLYSLIETDVTEEFIDKFKKLFITIVEPELPLWYITEGEK